MGAIIYLLGALSFGQLIDEGEIPNIAQQQPTWLEAHLRFERAGELMVAGDYQQARAVLEDVAAKFPAPYQELAHSAVLQIPRPQEEREPDPDELFGGDEADGEAVGVDDLFGGEPEEWHGDLAASALQPERRSNDELTKLAEVCCQIEAHAAALVLYRRVWEKPSDRSSIPNVVEQMWLTFARPEDAESLIDKIPYKSTRDYWEGQLQKWPTPWMGDGDQSTKLLQWRDLTPLTRLRAIETLRPQADTIEERVAILAEQQEALHQLGDYRQRDACVEAALQVARNRADICAAQLERAAYRSHRGKSTYDNFVAYFRRILDEYPSAPQFGKALAVVAGDAVNRNDNETAVRLYERLFAWASESSERTDYRQPHRVDLHRPARSLSLAYERQGELTRALEYARLAQTKYPYRPTCGTGYEGYLQCLQDRAFHLEEKIEASRKMEFEPIDLELISD